MKNRIWIILGASSVIAEAFAHEAAFAGHELLLVGRNSQSLSLIAKDLTLRHKVQCQTLALDFSQNLAPLFNWLKESPKECDLFIAHSLMLDNEHLTDENLRGLIEVNIRSIVEIIHCYYHKKQSASRIIFLSSVAAARGRAKNSLYGASKAAIEIYLEGLQQEARPSTTITIARLGFIDTKQTLGKPGVFYAAPPTSCAKACWRACLKQKRWLYYPFFWRFIMGIIQLLPFPLYRKIKH